MGENLFDTTDNLGRRVYMTTKRWETHVLYDKWWMHEFEQLIHRAVENPSFINYDAKYSNREVFYASGLIPATGEFLKVVVQFDEPDVGWTVTAYPMTKPKTGERKRWPL